MFEHIRKQSSAITLISSYGPFFRLLLTNHGSHPQFPHHSANGTVAAQIVQYYCVQRPDLWNISADFKSEGVSPAAMPRDNPLFTLLVAIAVCLHTVKLHIWMLWLTIIMQKPAAARRTIAIELLRRLDQMEGYRRRSQSIPAPHLGFADSAPETLRLEPICPRSRIRWLSSSATEPQFRLPEQDACGRATTTPSIRPNNSDSSTGTVINMPVLTHDAAGLSTNQEPVWTSSVHAFISRDGGVTTSSEVTRDLNKPQIQAEHNEKEAPAAVEVELTPPASPSKAARLPEAHDDARNSKRQHEEDWRLMARGGISNDASQFDDGQVRYNSIDSDFAPPLSAFEPSGSNATFYRPSTPLSGNLAADLEDDTVEGAKEDEFDTSSRLLVNTTDPAFSGLNESHSSEHQLNFSVESKSNAKRKRLSATLQLRSKTNGGLLELRASTTKSNAPEPIHIPRRNVSINLPIRSISSHPGGTQLTQRQLSASSAPTPKSSPEETSTSVHVEPELQYKHRHMFVGTASLHGFLEILETSMGSTSKRAIMRAFTILASNEQLMARQGSSSPEDWNLIARITADISEFDYFTLARVQLGSVSLQQFVDSIPFNTHDEAPTVVVVEAFKNASHRDSEEGPQAGSKARAFRRWLLSQGDTVE